MPHNLFAVLTKVPQALDISYTAIGNWDSAACGSSIPQIFTPSVEELAYYQGLLDARAEAERQGTAAVTHPGAMMDIATVKMAQQMLDFARAVGRDYK